MPPAPWRVPIGGIHRRVWGQPFVLQFDLAEAATRTQATYCVSRTL
jgi:hypothetical protein